MNLEDLKRIMTEQKTTLASLGNIEWRTIKMEMKKKIKYKHIDQQKIWSN